MNQQLTDFNFLTFIDPPSAFPPSDYDISVQIQSKFYNECTYFLKTQKKLYQCSKKIEQRLANSINDSASLDDWLKQRTLKLQKITRQLRKINHNYKQIQQKQEFLSSLCKFINMQSARNILLQAKIGSEQEYIEKLREIDMLSQQIKGLNSDIRVIVQVKQQLLSLLQQTVNKLIKGSISNSLLMRITSDASQPFLRDQKIAFLFMANLINQRLNHFKVGLNPLINNINYVQNVTELYQKIAEQWIRMLDQDLKIFCRGQVPAQLKGIPKQVMIRFVAQILPKMERGIYKVKNIVEISKIQHCLQNLKAKFEECGQSTWQVISKLLLKIRIILEQKLDQGAQQLQIAKYNIYSLVSYVPIRQYLQLIRQAKSYDRDSLAANWQRGFKKLADSRDPSKQPTNKSLSIFNLNIWFLYNHIMRQSGQLKSRAEAMIKQGINSIVNLNLIPFKKEYESKSMQKIFDLCADYQLVIKNLHAQIYLLHHERLRGAVQQELNRRFIAQIYQPLLTHNNLENGLTNQQAIQIAKNQKINLNKYGKLSQTLKVLSAEALKQMLG